MNIIRNITLPDLIPCRWYHITPGKWNALLHQETFHGWWNILFGQRSPISQTRQHQTLTVVIHQFLVFGYTLHHHHLSFPLSDGHKKHTKETINHLQMVTFIMENYSITVLEKMYPASAAICVKMPAHLRSFTAYGSRRRKSISALAATNVKSYTAGSHWPPTLFFLQNDLNLWQSCIYRDGAEISHRRLLLKLLKIVIRKYNMSMICIITTPKKHPQKQPVFHAVYTMG